MKKIIKVLIVLAALIAASAAYIIHCQNHLIVTEYEIGTKVTEPIRIVHLTDLHNHEFGENNSELIARIEDLHPDLIFMTGDMLNENDPDIDVVCHLISELKDTAPVYFSNGNHEWHWKYQENLDELVIDAGAVFVDNTYKDITLKNTELRIGGYYGYYRTPHLKYLSDEDREKEEQFFDEFEDTDRLKILLCHIPTSWADWKYMDSCPVDLIYCGHYHGGQVRIPFVGGLYSPYMGWFPKNTKGLFTGKYGTCILSTGLGSESRIPRINNDPEIVVTDLIP